MEVKQMREKLAKVVDTVPRKNDDVVKMYNDLNHLLTPKGEVTPPDGQSVANNVVDLPAPEVGEEFAKRIEASKANAASISKLSDNTYTYIGAGDEPPHQIKFMGIQVFTRGKATEVTNALILSKIDNNRSFVKGSVDADAMYEADQAEKKKADLQREEDVKVQIEAERDQRKA